MVRPVTEKDKGLHLLYQAATELDGKQPVDIIAVHGIGEHPTHTWCQKVEVPGSEQGTYINWLQDERMLPASVPYSKIWCYGYESQWYGDSAISTKASTVANRLLLALKRARKKDTKTPLLFIAHCFGGLVVIKALIEAKNNETQWPGIFDSTTGIVFLGTPFRGAGGLDQSELIQAAQSHYEQPVQGAIFNILAPGNETLMDLMDQFGQTRKGEYKARVACFFEQKPSSIGAIFKGNRVEKFVVDESSGCLDQSESTLKYSLARDHFGMNKFGSPDEEDFLIISEVVTEMVDGSPALLLARRRGPAELKIPFRLEGMPGAHSFVTRESELSQMNDALLPYDKAGERRAVFILHGVSGMG